MVIIEVLRCERCGAPLDVTPEDIIVVCPYCGYPNSYDKIFTEKNVFFVESLPKKEILRLFWERVGQDRDYIGLRGKVEIAKIEGFYVPLWFGKVEGHGYVRFVDYEKEGNKKKRVVRYREFEDNPLVCVPARRGVYDIAVETLAKKFERAGYITFKEIKNTLKYMMEPKPIAELTPSRWESLELEFLNTDFGKEQAKLALLDRASDLAKEKHVPKDTEIKSFGFGGEVEDFALVFYPLWKVYYDIEGGTYFVAYDGHKGKEVLALEPVRVWRKVAYALAALVGVTVAALFMTPYGNLEYWDFVAHARQGALLALIIPALLAYFGFGLARGYGRKMARDVRVER
ncbi:zinc ribbon domain-containing protein [Thermococcus thermotolerans]|uniref:zinc ribbon domain-containing protein n=1 Tax=Thermococcus thermotolerans TaxID=2969672 RepID=UPI00215755C4|nr:zinc ribbon domain-containing protein [Thermococcus thermotolerans]